MLLYNFYHSVGILQFDFVYAVSWYNGCMPKTISNSRNQTLGGVIGDKYNLLKCANVFMFTLNSIKPTSP